MNDDRGMQMLGNGLLYCAGWVLLATIWMARKLFG